MDFFNAAQQNEYDIITTKLNAFIAVFECKSAKWLYQNQNNININTNKYEKHIEILLFDLKNELKNDIPNLYNLTLLTKALNAITTNIKQETKETKCQNISVDKNNKN